MSDMRTPLSKVRGLGSAKSGTDHFWKQRLTALANIPLLIAFILILVKLAGQNYATVFVTLSNPIVTVIFLLLTISVLMHMRLGMQTVIEDYIHTEGTKIAALIANNFVCVVLGVASIYALLKIGFGG